MKKEINNGIKKILGKIKITKFIPTPKSIITFVVVCSKGGSQGDDNENPKQKGVVLRWLIIIKELIG